MKIIIKILKPIDKILFFLSGLIKIGFKVLGIYLGIIFNFLEKKYKFQKTFSLIGKVFEKIWNFDKYLDRNNYREGLLELLYGILILTKGFLYIASIYLFLYLIAGIFMAVITFINLYFPFVFDSINYLVSLVSNSLGYGFGLLAYFLLILFIIFIGNYLAGFISFFYVRYFGSVKKVKKRRLKKK